MKLVTPDEWMAHSHWYRRNLTAEHVGEIFSSDPRVLPSLPGFLAAYPLSLQTQWSLADIFNFLAEAHPHHVVSWVPRLFPLPAAPTWPARMLFATSVEIGPNDHLAPTGYFVDTEWPDCWIVSSGETVIVTCGTSVPARVVLRQAYLAEGAAFFRGGVAAAVQEATPDQHR
jgi:hypothetical protein